MKIKDCCTKTKTIEVTRDQQTVSRIEIRGSEGSMSVYVDDFGLHKLIEDIASALVWNDAEYRKILEE